MGVLAFFWRKQAKKGEDRSVQALRVAENCEIAETHHEHIRQPGVCDVVPDSSNDESERVLRSQHLLRPLLPPSGTRCRRSPPPRLLRSPSSCREKLLKRRDDSDSSEERVAGLQDVRRVDPVVIRVWRVIDPSDAEEKAVYLVYGKARRSAR